MESNRGNDKKKTALTRRQLLKCGLAAGAGIVAIGGLKMPDAKAQAQCPMPSSPASLDLTPYVDELPVPPVIESPNYTLRAQNITHRFHRDLPATPTWGFNGHHPGPTLIAYKNVPSALLVRNSLEEFVVCVTPDVVGGDVVTIKGQVVPFITIHNHGVLDPPEFDGGPQSMFPPGEYFLYKYPNINAPATYWYHDHALMTTRYTVYSGLAGFYLLLDPAIGWAREAYGNTDIPLVIQDRSFNADGTMWYFPPDQSTMSNYSDEFMGDFIAVNGKIWPYREVDRTTYMFRILNGSNHSSVGLALREANSDTPIPFRVIGNDEGFLPSPVTVTEVILGSAERANILVDFSSFDPDTEILMENVLTDSAFAPSMVTKVMKFIVSDDKVASNNFLQLLTPLPNLGDEEKTRHLTLTHMGDDSDMHLLNNLHFHAAPTETPVVGTTEIWNFYNLTDDMHPMHTHESRFLILDHRPFDVQAFIDHNGKDGPLEDPVVTWTGDAYPPPEEERGLKDTVKVKAGECTRIKVQFGPYPGLAVWHCHMLEHEDNDMMRPLLLTQDRH